MTPAYPVLHAQIPVSGAQLDALGCGHLVFPEATPPVQGDEAEGDEAEEDEEDSEQDHGAAVDTRRTRGRCSGTGTRRAMAAAAAAAAAGKGLLELRQCNSSRPLSRVERCDAIVSGYSARVLGQCQHAPDTVWHMSMHSNLHAHTA